MFQSDVSGIKWRGIVEDDVELLEDEAIVKVSRSSSLIKSNYDRRSKNKINY